ncbi:MAG: hypothetical protein KA775_04425 [Ottowia sp.]|nr:hypothetical protein [Ottowia sp.]
MKIDIRKHAREIGRHLRNRKFELTPAGVMIDKGGMNALVNGVFIDTLNGGDPQVSPNLVVDQGLIHVLNTVFAATTPITAWYIGLFSGNVTPQANWTAANIVANATELTGYSPSSRPPFTVSPVAAPSLGNTGNEANFAFDVSGPYTARGAFLISASNKGSTTGVLMAATRFATDRAGLNSPDNLGVRYVITATDAA